MLIANSLLVPKWATWPEFRRLEAEGLTMFGQMTAGSWIYIGTQGILQGTYQTFAAAGSLHFGSPDLAGRTILTAGLGGMGGAQPLAATMAGAAILCVEVDPERIRRRLETRYLDEVASSLDDARRARPGGGCGGPAAVGGGRGKRGRSRAANCHKSVNFSTSSPTRRRRTTRSPATCRRGCRSRKRLRYAVPTPTSTCGARASRSRGTSRRCSNTSAPAAMSSTMATTCEGRPMRQA